MRPARPNGLRAPKQKEEPRTMRKQIITVMTVAALSLPLMACGTSGGTTATTDGETTTTAEQSTADDDLMAFFAGTWRASVETTGNTVYGNFAGNEYMLDLVLTEDGTATCTPLEGHEDLLTGEGTWNAADDSAMTVTINGKDITLTVIDDATLEGNPTDFGIEGFDVLSFEYY